MFKIVLLSCLPLLCAGQQLGISISPHAIRHPKTAYHNLTGDWKLAVAGVVSLELANATDYATTYRGVVVQGGCEQNPLFVTAPCVFDRPRFTGVKIAAAALPLLEAIPMAFGIRSPAYIRGVSVVNFALTAPLAAADGNNLWVLTHWRK